MAGTGVSYCPNCGARTDPNAVICTKCGIQFSRFIGYDDSQKSKIAAGIMGVLLGSLGVHNFYLGYTKKAIAQLLISVLTLGVFSFVSAIWGFIEGILILTGSIRTDAYGIPLR